MAKFVTVDFYGNQLVALQDDLQVVVALKPIATAIGLDWSSQLKRLRRDPVLSEGMVMMTIPWGKGGVQQSAGLSLNRLHGWLFTIDSARVRNRQIRDRIQQFQRECYEVLFAHFSGGKGQRQAKLQMDRDRLSLGMVAECRLTHGVRQAAELWFQRGLPTVPSMEDALSQGDLFPPRLAHKAA